MHIKKLSLLVFVLFTGVLFANNGLPNVYTTSLEPNIAPPSCDLPAPTNFQVTEISTNWVALSWTPSGTPPAQYRIRTYDALTNNLVSTTNVAGWATIGRVQGLSPNVLYYSRITPVCQNGAESIYSAVTGNFRTVIIDVIVSGFTPAEGSATCPIVQSGNYCTFSNLTNEVTTFRIQPDGNPSAGRKFGMTYMGNGLFETRLNESNDGQTFLFRCSANSNMPCYNSTLAEIVVGNVVKASFTIITSASGATPPKLYCSYIDTAYEIVRLAPGFTSDEDRAVKPSPATDGAHISAVPNPFSDHIDVRFDVTDPSASVALHLYDLQGRLVMSHLTNATQPILSLSTEDLLPGMYFLRVEVGGESRTIKIVKTQ